MHCILKPQLRVFGQTFCLVTSPGSLYLMGQSFFHYLFPSHGAFQASIVPFPCKQSHGPKVLGYKGLCLTEATKQQ